MEMVLGMPVTFSKESVATIVMPTALPMNLTIALVLQMWIRLTAMEMVLGMPVITVAAD